MADIDQYVVVVKGQTSKRLPIFIKDSSVTTGAGKTGLAFNTASLVWYYWREDTGNAAGVAVTLATATRGTWATGGFIEIDSTNLPGWYEIGIPNAVLATGASWAVMGLKGAANMAPVVIFVQLASYDPNDAVRLGLTALPNANAEAAGGLFTRGSGAGQINQQANGQVDTNVARWLNVAVTADANNLPKVDVEDWKAGVVPAVNVTGVPKVDVVDWLGSAPNALISGRVDSNMQAVAASLLPVKKNTALAGVTFLMLDSTDGRTPKTGLTITAQRFIDGAAISSCTNAAAEVSNGIYKIDLSAADLNGNSITFRMTASGADPTFFTVFTQG